MTGKFVGELERPNLEKYFTMLLGWFRPDAKKFMLSYRKSVAIYDTSTGRLNPNPASRFCARITPNG